MPVFILAVLGVAIFALYERNKSQTSDAVAPLDLSLSTLPDVPSFPLEATSSSDGNPVGTYFMNNENQPRGIRNNNPGNLRPGDAWQGLSIPPVDGGGYLIFVSPFYGLRALAINLINQQAHHGLYSIRAIISKFAPPAENNTAAYIAAVSRRLGVDADTRLDLAHNSDLFKNFMSAIVQHENGQDPYDDSQYSAAVSAAIGR